MVGCLVLPAASVLAEPPGVGTGEPGGREVHAGAVPPELLDPIPALAAPAGAPRPDGPVVLRVTLDDAGEVRSVELLRSQGAAVDEAARRTALGLRFAPARLDGRPMPSRILVEVPVAPPASSRTDEAARPAPAAPLPDAPGGIVPGRLAPDQGDPSEPSGRSTRVARDGAGEPEFIDVLVTGSRVPERADEAVVSTEVIDREAIEQGGFRDVAEILEESQSVQVVRSFRGAELWLRGLDPEYTLVLVDGDRVPGRTGGAIDLSRYGVENVERVEIVRGPSSALYGSEAIGGVVNIITRPATDDDFEGDVRASYGSNGVLDVTARAAGSPAEGLRVSATGGYHRADAFGQATPDTATTGSAREQWSTGGRLEWRPSDPHLVGVSANYNRLQLEGVDAGAGTAVFDRTQLQEQTEARLTHRFAPNERLSLETRGFYSRYREQYLLDQRGSNRLDSYEDSREHLAQVTSTVRIVASPEHRVAFGFEQIIQQLESPRLSGRGRRTRFAFFAEDRWAPVDWFVLSPGIRVDIDSQFGNQVSPKIAVRADPTDDLVLRASYGRGFRAPSFQQLLLRFENPAVGYVVEGNPDVGAERSHGVDAGFEWQAAPDVSFGASFFRNDIQDLIAVVTADSGGAAGTLFTYDNIASAWTMGAESTARVQLFDLIELGAGYSFTVTRDEENDRQLEGRARHRPTASLRATFDSVDVDVTGRAAVLVGRTFYLDEDGDGSEERIVGDPLTQLDFRVEKRFGRHLGLFLGVDNVLDAGDRFTVFRPRTFYGGAWGKY
jgi:outer membrane receptor for ferrienterochelin and colicins